MSYGLLSDLLPYFPFKELLHQLTTVERVVSQVGFESLETGGKNIKYIPLCPLGLLNCEHNQMDPFRVQVLTLYSSEWRVFNESPFPSAWKHCSRH